MKSARAFIVALTATMSCRIVHAEEPAEATTLLRTGQEAAMAGDWRLACERFEASYRTAPAPATALDLGQCHEALGHLATAWAHYREAANGLPSADARQRLALAHVSALDARLSRITLQLDSLPEGASVELNGKRLELEELGVPLPVDAGRQSVRVSAPGRAQWQGVLNAVDGERIVMSLGLGIPLPSANPAQPSVIRERSETTPTSESSAQTWGYVATGVGSAGLIVGVVTGLLAIDAKNALQDRGRCPEVDRCNAGGLATADRGDAYATLSTVGFSTALAGFGVGTYLLVFHVSDRGATNVSIAPSAQAAMISLEGSL